MRFWPLIVLLLAGCQLAYQPQLQFALDSGEPLEGNVHLNGEFIGYASGGTLKGGNITSGQLAYTGTYQGRPFNITFNLGQNHTTVPILRLTIEKSMLERTSLAFRINDTGETIDGTVSLDGRSLGQTQDGKLSLDAGSLHAGTLELSSTYRGHPIALKFSIGAEDTDKSQLSFIISQSDLTSQLFDASELDRLSAEQQILHLINVERAKAGAPILKWNSRAAEVAYAHSSDMAAKDYFAHKNKEGQEVGDRLKAADIFYFVAAEDLSLFENLDPSVNITARAVDGWMKSPGHRAPIVDSDHLFSDGGAGIKCTSKTCYVTMVFLGNEREQALDLEPSYLSFSYLYDPNFGFSAPVPIRIRMQTDAPLNVYVVRSRSDYQSLVSGADVPTILRLPSTTSVDEQLTVTPGMGIIVENKGSKTVQGTLGLDYYP